jgi:predicted nucleic acid-binding protein
MKARAILDTASKLIEGERAKQYGNARESLALTARLWSEYLNFSIDTEEVGMMMVLLKVARTRGAAKDDNYIDIAGYAALTGQIVTGDD